MNFNFNTTALVAVSALALSASFAPAKTQDSMMNSKPAMAAKAPKALATTGAFKGVEVNGGNASIAKIDGKYHLFVSDDFKIPTSPAPHWQVIDAKGNTYLLQRFTIVGDKTNRHITLPSYITSVAKVQVWCSFAEVLLGEASFAKAQNLK